MPGEGLKLLCLPGTRHTPFTEGFKGSRVAQTELIIEITARRPFYVAPLLFVLKPLLHAVMWLICRIDISVEGGKKQKMVFNGSWEAQTSGERAE